MNNSPIMLWEKTVPDNLCDSLINIINEVKKTKPAELAKGQVDYNGAHQRKDFSLFLSNIDVDFSSQVNNILTDCLVDYANYFSILQKTALRSIQQRLQYTPVGGGYHIWHYENPTLSTSERVLTWTIYLNNVEEGGETEFLYESKRIKANKGTVCIFPASFEYTHRGNPPISNDKYILTGWYNLYE